MTSNQPTPEMRPAAGGRRSTRALAWSAAAVATLLVVVGAVMFVTAREEGSETVPTTATTHPAPTSAPTTATSAPATTSAPPPIDRTSAVWPYAASSTRYSDPVAAARGFAIDFVGFTSPTLGAFRPGDARSGEVDVRGAGGLTTTVLVRQLGTDATWWVLGAVTANIQAQQPTALATISSPVRLQGRSSAFEGTVQTEVRQDGAVAPLGRGFVTGGSGSELGPFDGMLEFTRPSAASGAVVLFTVSMENGHVAEATVLRVHFAAGGG